MFGFDRCDGLPLFLGWLGLLFKDKCSKHTRAKCSYSPHFDQVRPLAGQSAHLCGPLISPHQWHVFGSRLNFISRCFFRNDFDLPDPLQLTASSVPSVVSIMSLLAFRADSINLASATTSVKAFGVLSGLRWVLSSSVRVVLSQRPETSLSQHIMSVISEYLQRPPAWRIQTSLILYCLICILESMPKLKSIDHESRPCGSSVVFSKFVHPNPGFFLVWTRDRRFSGVSDNLLGLMWCHRSQCWNFKQKRF